MPSTPTQKPEVLLYLRFYGNVSSKMAVQDKCQCPYGEGYSDAEDYLQDPDLWGDRLPQPYRMILHIIDKLLDDTWDYIEQLQVLRQQEEAQVKVPEGTKGEVWCREVLTQSHGGVCGGRGVVFVGNGKSVLVMGCGSEQVGEVLGQQDLQSEVTNLQVVHIGETHILFIQHKTELKVFSFILAEFIEVASFPHMQAMDKIVKVTVSSTCSHVAITWITSENEVKLAVHMMPIESWLTELPHTTEESSQATVASAKKGTTPHPEDSAYSKPVFLYNLSSPPPLTPSTAASPHTIFQSVCEQGGVTVPSGELHSLTLAYFKNRRKRFVSRREHFVSSSSGSDTPTTSTDRQPTCHFLNHACNHRQAEIAVWWEASLSLTCYPLQELIGKATVMHPSKHLPQASPILCSCTSVDGEMLALGLQSGTVVVWDVRTGICSKVCSCVAFPDVITCLKFLQFPCSSDLELGAALQLAVGTAQGSVWVLDAAMNSTAPAKPLNARVRKQQQAYEGMFSSSGYDVQSGILWFELTHHLPSLLTSVHADGMVMIWNHTQQEAVCKLAWAEDLSTPTSSTFSDDGLHIFITGKSVDGNSCSVVCYDLSCVPFLTGHWDESSASSDSSSQQELRLSARTSRPSSKEQWPLLEEPERHMRHYVKLRLLDMEVDSSKWQKRWKELPNVLIQQ